MFQVLSQTDAAREARLRRAVRRQGYVLRRSRWRADTMDNFGWFQIIEPYGNWVVSGARFDMDFDDVERWLAE